MERVSKRIITMILATALLLVAAFVYTGTEAYAVQSKKLEVGQYYQLGTSSINNVNDIHQIEPEDSQFGENILGDKFPYKGQYYYMSDKPDSVATYIDPDISNYKKYYNYDVSFTYPSRITVGYS